MALKEPIITVLEVTWLITVEFNVWRHIMKQYKVVYPHLSNYPDPIVLAIGDVVIYGREDTEFPNWIFCEAIHSKKRGWVPKQILSKPTEENKATVLAHYSAYELTVTPGMLVEKEFELNEWSFVHTTHGEKGWVPNRVLVIRLDENDHIKRSKREVRTYDNNV
ncbi:variant SH3 domain-containing protein [Paenibacillus pabuli]|uniref:Variant SH3 domain-containing protein n=2 Tax=Paenibacillus TaxID=44249 RepID=A0ABX9BMS7_9BACL|nr:variant SH3 domain-containing protein [Paenibacillus pabuli]